MSFEDDEASCVARIAQVRAHEFPGGGNHDGSESSARQNQTTSVSLKKAKP